MDRQLKFAFALCAAAIVGFNNPLWVDHEGTRNALIAEGLEVERIGGYAFWGCRKGYIYATRFVAKMPNGQVVEGRVCAKLSGEAKVRYG